MLCKLSDICVFYIKNYCVTISLFDFSIKINSFISFLSRRLVRNQKELLKTVNTFKAVSINHSTQKDGVSCGLYVIEV